MWKKISVIGIIIISVAMITTVSNYLVYNYYYNDKMIDIINQLVKENEELDLNEIAHILKNPENSHENVIKTYGYDGNDLYLVGDMKQRIGLNMGINFAIMLVSCVSLISFYQQKKKKNLAEIENLIELLEKINSGNFGINLNEYTESDFSKLRNEIYKTVVLLKEHTEFLAKDRLALKNNIADISHQLRTPLTSIGLMLESMIDDKTMTIADKEEFVLRIYKQTEKINYLIESLLKLSRFDASVVEFKKETIYVATLLDNVKASLQYLASQKGVVIQIEVKDNIIIECDGKWQEEAITNIVKNCIDFSHENGVVEIKADSNHFYTTLTIKDNGQGMSKEELKKIFLRFHKSKNSKGFGIGLNLAKTMIEKDGGMIEVQSKEGEYTQFTVKYIK